MNSIRNSQAFFLTRKQAFFSGSKERPGDQAGILFVLYDDTKVNILDSNNGWIKGSIR